jgi:phage gp16-like protein
MSVRRRSNSSRKRELAMIHIAADQLGLDEATYRDMLWTVARVRSAGELDEHGRDAVLAHLKQCGWRATRNKPSPYRAGSQAALVRHIWTRLAQGGAVANGSDRALRAYVRHQTAAYSPTGEGWDDPRLVPKQACCQLIEQMKRFAGRKGIRI